MVRRSGREIWLIESNDSERCVKSCNKPGVLLNFLSHNICSLSSNLATFVICQKIRIQFVKIWRGKICVCRSWWVRVKNSHHSNEHITFIMCVCKMVILTTMAMNVVRILPYTRGPSECEWKCETNQNTTTMYASMMSLSSGKYDLHMGQTPPNANSIISFSSPAYIVLQRIDALKRALFQYMHCVNWLIYY